MSGSYLAQGLGPGGAAGERGVRSEHRAASRRKGIQHVGTSSSVQSCECACVKIVIGTPAPPRLTLLARSQDAEGADRHP